MQALALVKASRARVVQVSRSEPAERVERRVMRVSAYTAGFESTGKTTEDPTYGQTAISTPTHKVYAKEWYTVAAPLDIPTGTDIYIPYFKDKPNHGVFVVEDRGGRIKGNKLDVYFGDPVKDGLAVRKALEFGTQELVVEIRVRG